MGPNMSTAGTSQGGSAHGSVVGGGGASPAALVLPTQRMVPILESSSSAQSVVDTKATAFRACMICPAGGVLTSDGKNVKLSGGVRMILT